MIILLREYDAKSIITSISSKECIMSTIKNYNVWGVSDSFVSRLDGCSMFLGPLELGVFAREGIQQAYKVTILGDEFTIIATKTKVVLDFTKTFHREGAIEYGFHFSRVNSNSSTKHNMSEVLDLRSGKVTLLKLAVLFSINKTLHNMKHMVIVYFQCGGVNQDVVEVYNYKVIEPIVKQRIHGSLECGWGIRQSKRHNKEFIYTISRSACSFGFIAMADWDLVVATIKFKFGELFSIDKTVV